LRSWSVKRTALFLAELVLCCSACGRSSFWDRPGNGTSPTPDGSTPECDVATPCDAGVCIGGTCQPGCLIDGGAYQPGEFIEPEQALCQQCRPDVSTTASTLAPLGTHCPLFTPGEPTGACALPATGGPEICTCELYGGICHPEVQADGGLPCCRGFCNGGICCTTDYHAQCRAPNQCCSNVCCGLVSDGGYGYCSPDGGC
jgi:hypothetical protein